MICKLALEDGTVLTGDSFGAAGTQLGEVVFCTAMTGYQEIFTDPSYCGQIVTMTFPLIGNYGVNPQDVESARPYLSGFVVKELPPRPSNFRATASFADLLRQHNVMGIAGIDTRALTRRLRTQGALRGALSTEVLDDLKLVQMAAAAPAMQGANLVDRVCGPVRPWSEPLWTPTGGAPPGPVDLAHADEAPRRTRTQSVGPVAADTHIVAFDCGIKSNILRYLVDRGCRVTVVPADTPAGKIRELKPDGLLIGNGPGDPAAVTSTIATLRELLGRFPVFGICLGHQMIALALGATTYKLKFGHHGANQPVLNRPAERVEITSQNHGFAVDAASLERVGGAVTHINLNDDSVEGYVHADQQVVCVQFHPEASPGPHDAGYLFGRFVDAVQARRPLDTDLLCAVES